VIGRRPLLKAAVLPFLGKSFAATAKDVVYVAGSGVAAYRFEPGKALLERIGVVDETPAALFLATNRTANVLYVANAGSSNSIGAFSSNPKTGDLKLRKRVSVGGPSPCHFSVHPGGRWLAVANYGDGSVAILPIDAAGAVAAAATVVRTSTPKSRAHAAVFSPDGGFLLVADIAADRIYVYRFDPANGALTAHTPAFTAVKAGSGVRHLAFLPGGKVLYAVHEDESIVTAFHYDAAAATLEPFQTVSTIPAAFKGENAPAEIAANAAGSRLYVSNRGHNSIAIFAVDPGGSLSLVTLVPTRGAEPRHFTFDPTGEYLLVANQESGDIAAFHVDAATGALSDLCRVRDAGAPSCLAFAPSRS